MKNHEYYRVGVKTAAVVLILVLAVFSVQAVCAQSSAPNVVEAVGTAVIRNRNLANAKEEALAAAMIAGVDQVAARMFSADTLSESFKKFNETVLGHASDFVENYQVLAEGASGKHYRVMLRVTVSVEMLRQKFPDFAITEPRAEITEEKPFDAIPEKFPEEAEKPAESIPEISPEEAETPAETVPEISPEEKKETGPKILFLIAEQDLQDMEPSFWWGEKIGNKECYTENAMRDTMKAAGFHIIEHGSGLPKTEKLSHILFEPDIENAEAAAVGIQMKAQVVIAGKAIVYKVQDDTDTEEGEIPSFNATLTVRAILAENGREIFSLLETAVQRQSSENQSGEQSLMAAGTEAAKKLIPQISRIWDSAKEQGDRLELIVKGTRNLGNFVRFRKSLNEMPDVKNIQVQSIESDAAEIRISFGKDTQAFADAVKKMKFDSFGIEIRVISGRRLEIALIPK